MKEQIAKIKENALKEIEEIKKNQQKIKEEKELNEKMQLLL